MQNLDQIINEYYTKNTARLESVAYNILIKIRKTELASSLVTDSYLHVYKHKEDLTHYITGGNLDSVVINFMSKQVIWSNTEFKKNFTNYYSQHTLMEDLTEEDGVTLIENEVLHEDPVLEKEILDERIREEMAEAGQKRHLEKRIKELCASDLKLYQLRFIEKLSYRKIAEQISINLRPRDAISYSSVRFMVLKLQTELNKGLYTKWK